MEKERGRERLSISNWLPHFRRVTCVEDMPFPPEDGMVAESPSLSIPYYLQLT